jgi:hypothetical protein
VVQPPSRAARTASTAVVQRYPRRLRPNKTHATGGLGHCCRLVRSTRKRVNLPSSTRHGGNPDDDCLGAVGVQVHIWWSASTGISGSSSPLGGSGVPHRPALGTTARSAHCFRAWSGGGGQAMKRWRQQSEPSTLARSEPVWDSSWNEETAALAYEASRDTREV